jgi:signal transduction histidine kinase
VKLPTTIRWRLQVWYGLWLALLAGVLITATYHFEKERRFRKIDQELQQGLSNVTDALRRMPERGPAVAGAIQSQVMPAAASLVVKGGLDYVAIWMNAAEPVGVSANAPAGIPKPEAGQLAVRIRGDRREAFISAAPVDVLMVGRSVDSELAELSSLLMLLVTMGIVLLGGGLFGGMWIVSRAIQPVDDIVSAALKIEAGDLRQRISEKEGCGELVGLVSVLNRTFERLATVFEHQGRFIGDAAHELRTPVAIMLAQIQSALAMPLSAEEYQETLQACQRAAQRMRRLIEGLLKLARLGAGAELLDVAAVDLPDVVREVLEQQRTLALEQNIEWITQLEPALCRAEREFLHQVAGNLVSNAIHYNQPGGWIRLSTLTQDDRTVLKVSNSGPGIPAAELPLVFERFYRAEKSRANGGHHSGLGLAIVEAIVKAHGGDVAVESELNVQTTFTVRLPIWAA